MWSSSTPSLRGRLARRAAAVVLIALAGALSSAGAMADAPEERHLAMWINDAVVDYPGSVEFRAHYVGAPGARSVDLEYGMEPARSCDGGALYSERLPASGYIVWRWDAPVGWALPPKGMLRWRWRLTDADGAWRVSSERRMPIADARFEWQSHGEKYLTVHWYGREPEFGGNLAALLLAGGERGEPLGEDRSPVDVFVYESDDAPEGSLRHRGAANPFRQHNALATTFEGDFESDEWEALTHELARFAILDRGFNCFGGLPHWLEEGLASYLGGEMSQEMRRAFAEARLAEQFVPLRSFNAPFGAHLFGPRALYSQAHDLVAFLIERFGWESLLSFIDRFKVGARVDDALLGAFGVDTDAVETLWRRGRGLEDPVPIRMEQP